MAIRFNPNATAAYVKYAQTYFYVNPKVAIEKLESLLAANPNSALAQREVAEKYYEDDQWTKAAEKYGEYITNPNHFKQDMVRYAALLFYGKNYEKSYQLADKLIRELPAGDQSVFYMKRMKLYNKVAMEQWDDALAIGKDFFATALPAGTKHQPKDYTDYADALKNTGDVEGALAQRALAYEANPDKTDLLKDLSSEYNELKDYANAAKYYQLFIDKGDYKTNDLYVLAGRYLNVAATATDENVKNDAITKGIKYVTEVNEKAPGDHRVISRKARLELLSEVSAKEGKAVNSYKEMIEVLNGKDNPGEFGTYFVEAYRYIAVNANENGNKEVAKEYYQKWLSADPTNEDLRKYVEGLK